MIDSFEIMFVKRDDIPGKITEAKGEDKYLSFHLLNTWVIHLEI